MLPTKHTKGHTAKAPWLQNWSAGALARGSGAFIKTEDVLTSFSLSRLFVYFVGKKSDSVSCLN